ncbi:hypothetical protein AO385_1781 [Moraxella catarrhalis]|uniref:Uncharacterized protein n=1 Tax=Moraxella catarrhalis TaxID=480 RepID=A0A198UDH0_MORCA|nr:hypothetical protein AO384_1818 [Moraxella catarrhalis]OAU94909.1 hypothetical protein AO383_2101 [Moraxella catarrhalis]OAU96915.1 hypothetical protein AO385_1781 [Moraxella catarrhalis]
MLTDKFNLTLEQNRFLAKKTSLKSFYESNDDNKDNKIVAWTYENCLYGMTI